jgi:hypothetical protein
MRSRYMPWCAFFFEVQPRLSRPIAEGPDPSPSGARRQWAFIQATIGETT